MRTTAIIQRLQIHRYRGLQTFDWRPLPGMNTILGGGDVGKTTILDALALLFSPSNSTAISESDYWQRNTEAEFVIEATVALPASTEIGTQKSMNWPWEWNGTEAVPPKGPDEGPADPAAVPVYRVRVRGTPELEPAWEIVQPDGTVDYFSVGIRRKIGLVRLSSDERNDRDLRLVYGSALDRLMADNALRARIGKRVGDVDIHGALNDESKQALTQLDTTLKDASLPHGLKLGMTSSQGISIGALIGVLANHQGVEIPLASWGAGTRRMASLEIAASTATSASITTIDEIERGLEPYRLRKLISAIEGTAGQAFVTTHSAVAIQCALTSNLWYLDAEGHIGPLQNASVVAQQRRDPETFLAKLAVIVEGDTEVGFLRFLLERAFKADPLDYGLRICNGQGNDALLILLETLADANLAFAGLADNEGTAPQRWGSLKTKMGARLHQWAKGSTEENVITAMDDAKLSDLITNDEDSLTGYRYMTLATRLGIFPKKDLPSINAELAKKGLTLKELIIQAATGSKANAPAGREKEWGSHAQNWFKSERGGRELAEKMEPCGAWPVVQALVLPFINELLGSSGLQHITELKL